MALPENGLLPQLRVGEYIGEQKLQWEERKRARAVRDAEREVQHREWVDRQRSLIARWASRIDQSESFIRRLKEQISIDMAKK